MIRNVQCYLLYFRLKSDEVRTSPENKTDEYEVPEVKSNSRHHCKALVLVHSKCFTISLFVALHHGIYVHCVDVQSAMDQCDESISEVDITDYVLVSLLI